MFVYAFWEPRDGMPAYLKLCMQTWKKNLPNAEIILLDYKNLGDFVDEKDFGVPLFSDKLFLDKLGFKLISDAIRVGLLAKHGGVWLDCDWIILSHDAEKYLLPDEKHRTLFFGTHLAFINAPPNAPVMTNWLEFIKERLRTLTPSTEIPWSFLGNDFINDYREKHPDQISTFSTWVVSPDHVLAFWAKRLANWSDFYRDYYFYQSLHLADVKAKAKEMLMLVNSWSPAFYRNLTLEEILRCDCTMTNILAEILEIELPPQNERLSFKEMVKK